VELPPELEDAIAAAPDDREGYAVAGDWLAQQGDPQGELVGLSRAGDEVSDRVLALQQRLAPVSTDRLAPTRLEWRWGFVRGATYSGRDPEELRRLLAAPVCRFLQKLVIHDATNFSVSTIYETRRSAPRNLPCLRTLQIVRDPGASLSIDLDKLSTLHSLERLGLRVFFTRGRLALPRLRELTLAEIYEPTTVVATGDLPALERLQISVRDRIAPLDRWLRPPELPRLRRLTLASPNVHEWEGDAILEQLDHFSFFVTPTGIGTARTLVRERSLPSRQAALMVMVGRGAQRPGMLIAIKSGLSIGRGSLNDLVLADPDVADRHAEIFTLPRWQIRARDTALTYVEGHQISECPLSDGDDLGIGRHVLRFLDSDLDAKAAALRKRYGF
jgi:uncharacterized protein (TIGR02996 family)